MRRDFSVYTWQRISPGKSPREKKPSAATTTVNSGKGLFGFQNCHSMLFKVLGLILKLWDTHWHREYGLYTGKKKKPSAWENPDVGLVRQRL